METFAIAATLSSAERASCIRDVAMFVLLAR